VLSNDAYRTIHLHERRESRIIPAILAEKFLLKRENAAE